MKDNPGHADVAVVLGNKIELSGVPSEGLRSRLEEAVKQYHNGYFKKVIVSGGIGKEGFDEAQVMKDYMVAREVPAEDIIMDNKGDNSYATAVNSEKIMKDHGWKSAFVISQYYHISRTKLAMKKAGITKLYSSSPSYFTWKDLLAVPREFVAYYYYLVMY